MSGQTHREMNVNQWEKDNHEDLVKIFRAFFHRNIMFDCSYSDYVNYAYEHSDKVKSNKFD